MQNVCFYDFDDENQALMLEVALGNRGVVVDRLNGMCGDIFVFDQGHQVHPRYVCAKVPRRLKDVTPEEVNKRFLAELGLQLRFYHHTFVHWCFDLKDVLGAPVALFRYWDGDLRSYMSSHSEVTKLSLIAYCCSGLLHCYERGLVAHQDMKPANIFIRDFRRVASGLPDLDIYLVALIADFGLANASVTSGVFDGSRPYMAPEQWSRSTLSQKTDVFALGIILHELMSGGFHPVGVRTAEVWPSPSIGVSKKWTRPGDWRKWIDRKCPLEAQVELKPDVKRLIELTLSIEPESRPAMAELRTSILDLIKTRSEESHYQLQLLIDHFDREASQDSIETDWPYVAKAWQRLQERFS
ncbi:protein kinase domain-containing protein [Pseudomonas serbica]